MSWKEYAASRGISPATLERFDVGGGTAFFRELGRKAPGIAFRYWGPDGSEVGAKCRCIEVKDFTQREGSESVLWNLPAIVTQETVYITEGEFDAMSLVEAGIDADQVTTVPNASTAGKALLHALDHGLNGVKKFVLCGDQDEAGLSSRQVILKTLGPARCWFVDWPKGIKDANQMLQTVQADGLAGYLEGAKPWPVEGLYTLDQLPEPPPLTPWIVFPEWESKLLFAPGTLSVFTGHPGHGKSHLLLQILYHIAARYGVKFVVASMETRPIPHARRMLRSFRHKKLEKDLAPEQCDEADDFIREHFLFMEHPDHRPTPEWVLDTAEVAVVRHGCRGVVTDPWNKLESHSGDIDTQWIGKSLDAFYDFANDLNVWVPIVAHPTKLGQRAGQAPLLEDIAGSKHWDNRVDQGVVIHADDGLYEGDKQTFERSVYVRKARYPEIGRPSKLNMRLDPKTWCYVSTDYETIADKA